MTGVAVIHLPSKAFPQGSKKAFVVPGANGKPRAVMTESSSTGLKAYRNAVAARAGEVIREPHTGPVTVSCTFTFQRPLAHYVGGRRAPERLRSGLPVLPYPSRRGDIDKLVRSTLDALTGPAFNDDAQVVQLDAEVFWGDEDCTVVHVAPLGTAVTP